MCAASRDNSRGKQLSKYISIVSNIQIKHMEYELLQEYTNFFLSMSGMSLLSTFSMITCIEKNKKSKNI